MLTATVFTPDAHHALPPAEISEVVDRTGHLLWVDVVDPTDDDMALLVEEFSLHELAVEDARKHGQRPKIEIYDDCAFIVGYAHGGDPADLPEVDLFVGPTWLVSIRARTTHGSAMDVVPTFDRFERTREHGVEVGILLYTILDDLVDGYFDVVERAEDSLEAIEADLFADDGEDDHSDRDRRIQRNLLDLRRDLILLRRRVVPMRDVVLELLRGEIVWVSRSATVYMQNVLDHLLRLVDQIDTQRELLGNVVDAHLALQANRMNQVMKKMTSWGAILIVATLIAGIYGMNFKNMPELGWRFGYAGALTLMLLSTTGLWVYFKRKDWL